MNYQPRSTPSAAQLGAAERERLRRAHNILQATPDGDSHMKGGQMLADFLREQVPDLDDVTMGRTVLAIGAFLAHLAKSDAGEQMPLVAFGNYVMGAGLQLTEPEWNEESRP